MFCHYINTVAKYHNTKIHGISVIKMSEYNVIYQETFYNIYFNKKSIKKLVKRCNALNLDPTHFHDVILDYIKENITG